MSLKKIATEAKLLLIGIPVLIWTLFPVYHMVLFAISPRDTATSGHLWPEHPTLQNFEIVFKRDHFYLDHFWQQLGNSFIIALAVGALTLLAAWLAALKQTYTTPEETAAHEGLALASVLTTPAGVILRTVQLTASAT